MMMLAVFLRTRFSGTNRPVALFDVGCCLKKDIINTYLPKRFLVFSPAIKLFCIIYWTGLSQDHLNSHAGLNLR